MASIKGLTLEINGDVVGLNKALASVNTKSRDLQGELRQVEKLLKLDPGNTELLAQKQKLLASSIENTSEKLKTLKTASEQAQEKLANGEIGDDQYRALQREIIKTEQDLNKLTDKQKQANGIMTDTEKSAKEAADALEKTAKAEAEAAKKAEELHNNAGKAKENLKNMGKAATVGAVAVGAAFVGMGATVLSNADELQRQADVTGLSAERLQELQYAGNNLGVELDTLTGAQAKLTKSMFAAKDGTGSQADAFSSLGISVLDSNGQMRDAKTVMEEAFTALNGVGNETERNQLAMQLFGKSAMDLNPIINAGGEELGRLAEEARNTGAVMSDEAVAGLDSFGDTMDNVKNSVLGSFGEKFAEILPAIQEFLSKLQELPGWIEKNSTLLEIIGIAIGTVTTLVIAYNIQQALMGAGMTLWTAIAGVGTAVTSALGAAFAFLTSPIGIAIVAIGAIIAVGVLLYKNWDTIKAKCSSVWGAITAKFSETVEKIKGFFSGLGESVSQLPGLFKTIGGNIVKGLWDGVAGLKQWIKGKFTGFIDLLPGWAKKVLGIHSPSTEFRDQVGKNIVLGIGKGIEENEKKVIKTVEELSQHILSEATKWVDEKKLINNLTLEDELAFWKDLKTMSGLQAKELAEIEKKAANTASEISKGMLSKISKFVEEKKFYNQLTAQNELKLWKDLKSMAGLQADEIAEIDKKIYTTKKTLREEEEKVQKEFENDVKSRADSLKKYAGIFDEIKEKTDTSGSQLLQNLRDQVTEFENWQKNMADLEGKGISRALLDELRDLGPKAASEIKALNTLSEKELTEYVELFQKKAQLANEQALSEMSPFYASLNNMGDIKGAATTLERNINYAIAPVTEYVQPKESNIADIVGQALLTGLMQIGDSIFDAIPKELAFLLDGRELARAEWGNLDDEGGRRSRIFAPSREQIANIAMSVMPKKV